MKRLKFICAVVALFGAAPAVLQTKPLQSGSEPRAATVPAAQADQGSAVINTYCTGCHNSKLAKPAGGLALDTATVQTPSQHPEIWEKAMRKLRGRLMPPPGAKQPENLIWRYHWTISNELERRSESTLQHALKLAEEE